MGTVEELPSDSLAEVTIDAINQRQPPGGRRAGSREAVPLVACAFSSGLLPKPQPTSV